jgi:hypothetical protein
VAIIASNVAVKKKQRSQWIFICVEPTSDGEGLQVGCRGELVSSVYLIIATCGKKSTAWSGIRSAARQSFMRMMGFSIAPGKPLN